MFKRLMKDDPESWALYPFFEQRVKSFAEEFDITCPIEPIIYEMQQRWFMTPNLAGYYVEIENSVIKSHFASWITSNYGINKLYIYQAQVDGKPINFLEFWPCVQAWVMLLNKSLEPKFQVQKTEFCTWHDSETWMRYFRLGGLKSLKLRSIIETDIL